MKTKTLIIIGVIVAVVVVVAIVLFATSGTDAENKPNEGSGSALPTGNAPVSNLPAGSYPIKKGSYSSKVQYLQTKLNEKFAAGLVVDGAWGSATETAASTHLKKNIFNSKSEIDTYIAANASNFVDTSNGLSVSSLIDTINNWTSHWGSGTPSPSYAGDNYGGM